MSIAGAAQLADISNSNRNNVSILNKSDEAIKVFDNTIEINPQDSDAWTNKGLALYKLNKFDEAIKAFDKAIEINPQDSMAWYNRASSYSLTNNKKQAIFNLKKAIELDSSYKEKAKKEEVFKKRWTDEQFISLLSTTEYRKTNEEVKAEEILKHIENGDDIYLQNCNIIGELNVSKIKLKTVPIPYNDVLSDYRAHLYSEKIFYGVNKNLSIIKSNISIKDSTFENELDFSTAQFNNTVSFEKTIFNKFADFHWVNFNNSAKFWAVTFNNSADFGGTIFNNSVFFIGAYFNKSTDFSMTQFIKYASFYLATFNNSVDFSHLNFQGYAEFFRVNFNNFASFTPVIFSKGADFSQTHFNNSADFNETNFFGSSAYFEGANFSNSVYFYKSKFNGLNNFSGPETPEKVVLDGKNFYTFFKYYTDTGRYGAADIIYYNYRYADLEEGFRRHEFVSFLGNFLSWFTCGFGVKPLYTIRFGIAIIFLFSLIYANPKFDKTSNKIIPFGLSLKNPGIVNGNDQNQKAHLLDLIYYSFGSFTFMSQGDWKPRDHFKKWVALEGVLGWVVLGIFMAVLTKTIIRI